jgi:thiosulfate dehydrogenase
MRRILIGFILGLLVLPVIAALVAFSGRFPFEATARPPRWERQLAGMALDPAIGKKAAGVVNPLSATDDNLMKGMKVYRDDCAGCHGDRGKPSGWGRHNFYPPVPQLADRGDEDPVPEIFVVVKNGVRYTGMGAWNDQIPEADMWCVAMFLSRVKSLPPAVEAAWKAKS